jgi:hypothetical protein
MDEYKHFNYLGYQNPFYIKKNEKFFTNSSLQRVLNEKGDKNEIDLTAIAEVLNKGFIFGNRTLIKGVNKTPWMAKPNKENCLWEYSNLPNHSNKRPTEEEIAENLFALLKQEMLEYIKEHSFIGILLTGGMDSRIVACVLNDLIKTEAITNKQVIAITWGKENSRDVVYASRIAKIFKWEWIHLTVDAEQLLQNMEISIELGCEISPIHFHALSKVAALKGIDCILGGSFGDSIGRGEYSGVHVKSLKSLNSNFGNIAGVLRTDFLKYSQDEIATDIIRYHDLFPQRLKYQQYEQDYQLHYMRRMLNPCFSIIASKLPVNQMFTSPEVFGYMWSIDPTKRNNMIYQRILEKNCSQLLEIPWARTGLRYPSIVGQPDDLNKEHHDYGKLIRQEIFPIIEKKIEEGPLEEMNIFNTQAIKDLMKLCVDFPNRNLFYEDKLIWLGTLSDFIQKHDIVSSYEPKSSSLQKFITYIEYFGRYYKNKF